DTFIYTTINDSATGSPNDAILDFERGIDRIDLSAFAGNMDFVGGGAFTGGGTGSVRYSVNPKGHAVVRIDSDGDGIEDMRVVVLYTPLLDAGDFVL
ncbi:MAG TPA: M10 family metallopeptidase C-terminal domain-containing protein, partial [Paracoccaceae bacterium]|nr:M10 family metallopeptidase C-terminal domain-containing protein [Paracoccaceae bacterium]